MQKKSLFSLVAIGVLALGLFFGFLWGQNTQIIKPATVGAGAFSLMIDYGEGEITNYPDISLQSDRNLFTLMRKTILEENTPFEYEEYQDLGVLITRIGDSENGTDNKYWQYWVNNHFAQVAASSYVVEEGDIIEWKFVKQQLYEQ
jgi:hypothetical protein